MGITYRQGHEGRLSIEEMDNNFHYIEDCIAGLTGSLSSLSSLEVGLSASLTALTALEHLDVAGLTASVLTLNTNLASATASIGTLNTNLASATASIGTLNTNLASATASILGLSMSIDNISLTPGPTGATGADGVDGVDGAQGPEGPQGIEGPVGVSGLTWQGAWSNNSLYNKNDAVGWASASWWCVATVSSTASVIAPDLDTTHINWTLLAAQGSQGPMGAQGIQGPTGSQGIQGVTGPAGSGDTLTYNHLTAGSSFPYPGITSSFVRVSSTGINQRVTLPTTTVLGTEVRVGNTSTNTIIVYAGFGISMYLNGIGSDLGFNTEIGIPPGEEYMFVYIKDYVWSAYKTNSSAKTDYYTIAAGTTASHVTLSYDINTVTTSSSNAYVYLPSNPYNGQEVIVVPKITYLSGNTFTVLSPINSGFIENGNGASQGITIVGNTTEARFVYTQTTYNATPYWHYYPIERVTVSSSIDTAISNGTISNVTKKWKTTITTAQVLQLFTTPIEILPAQSGYARIPTNIYIKRNAGTASYTLANNAFLLLDGNNFDTNTNINPNPLISTQVGYTNNTIFLQESVSGSDHGGPYKLKASTGNPTIGNGSLDVYVTYEEFFIGF